ncbi:MAG: hypothetical protein CMN03_02995, partial [Roseibacillus sp.]|nr:hypothetical protein [Roseibacillus sp.]
LNGESINPNFEAGSDLDPYRPHIGEEENVDGEMYQTGLAAYKAQTIFGEKTVQAKALIQKGKVVKWIYAKTGMEIR